MAGKLTKISLSDDRVLHQMAEGLGFNWYSCFKPETYPASDDENRWAKIFSHADWLNMNFIRYGQAGGSLCDNAGNFKPGHDSFKQLVRVDNWAKRRGVSLLLDPFSIPKPFQFEKWEGAPLVWEKKDQYAFAVEDIDGYVNRFAIPYLRHVIHDLNCTSVKWFNFVNEPLNGGVFAAPPPFDDHVRYVEVLKALRQAMDEAGFSSVGLMGPDSNTHHFWPIPHMLKMGMDPDPYIQAYCVHQYHSYFDWDKRSTNMPGAQPMQVGIHDQLARYCSYAHERNKPYLVTEVGMFHYGWAMGDPAGIARHDNVILELEFIVRGMREKADGFLRWAWLNPGDMDGWWQLIQTTDASDAPMQSPYFGYGTLLRHVDRQAKILNVTVEHHPNQEAAVHAVAVENPDKSRSLIIINDAYSNPVQVDVEFKSPNSNLIRKIVCDPVRKYVETSLSSPVNNGEAEWNDVLSPMSITVYTTK